MQNNVLPMSFTVMESTTDNWSWFLVKFRVGGMVYGLLNCNLIRIFAYASQLLPSSLQDLYGETRDNLAQRNIGVVANQFIR